MKMTLELWDTTAIHRCRTYAVFNQDGMPLYWKRLKRADEVKFTAVNLEDMKQETRNELTAGWKEYMAWQNAQT